MENQAKSTFNTGPLISAVTSWGSDEIAQSLDDMIFDYINVLSTATDNQLSRYQANNIHSLKLLRDALREGYKPLTEKLSAA